MAGLAAIQTAKNMGAIVRAFDVRPVCKEQVESMGAAFLEVDIEEDGSGAGGYAKEMSDEYKAAQAALMLDQARDVDIIITTALIPGRKAPILVNQEMLDVMKPGSVCVDLAAANGGNVEQTQPDEIVTTSNGVKIIGYTDLPSRLAATASNLVSYPSFFCSRGIIIVLVAEIIGKKLSLLLLKCDFKPILLFVSLATTSQNSSLVSALKLRRRRVFSRLISKMTLSRICWSRSPERRGGRMI